MKNQPAYSASVLPARPVNLHQFYWLTLLACLVALVSACTASQGGSAKGQPLRLAVGEIKEVTIDTRADTTWQLTATSDNQEVVDVSRKPPVATTGGGATATGTGIFLIKGITAGRAKVVFSEKQMGADGEGKTKKTYLVTVTTK